MKKIIGGKVYNTDTAKEVGYCSNGRTYRDFSYCEETLYRKKTGEFFLHGSGGPMTKYAEPEGNNGWSGGSRIMPMAYEDAKTWAEKNLTADEYETIFGVVDESDEPGKRVVSINVSIAKWENAKRRAAAAGVGISEYIESLL